MTFGSLFAGIGGMDLGLERAGWECRWQVEIDPYARRVLERHWPDVRRHDDVRTFPPSDPGEWAVDLIAGGFPCQDISNAGRCAGVASGQQSSLWQEFARIVGLIRPRFVLVENSPAILAPGRGFDIVLGDLAAIGYDAEWDCVPAAALGAPHLRDRLFAVAYPGCERLEAPRGIEAARRPAVLPDRDVAVVDTLRVLRGLPLHDPRDARPRMSMSAGRGFVVQLLRGTAEWADESPICRVDDGIPARVDRIRGLGNAVVPRVAEWIGRRLIEAAR